MMGSSHVWCLREDAVDTVCVYCHDVFESHTKVLGKALMLMPIPCPGIARKGRPQFYLLACLEKF